METEEVRVQYDILIALVVLLVSIKEIILLFTRL